MSVEIIETPVEIIDAIAAATTYEEMIAWIEIAANIGEAA